mmetsp:Transcript_33550/g.79611  ORF Transcript_33550/g.79611 Transcript_33550/m.79611 type:complete len:227 (+) Transcript_33550:1811-2491(+)
MHDDAEREGPLPPQLRGVWYGIDGHPHELGIAVRGIGEGRRLRCRERIFPAWPGEGCGIDAHVRGLPRARLSQGEGLELVHDGGGRVVVGTHRRRRKRLGNTSIARLGGGLRGCLLRIARRRRHHPPRSRYEAALAWWALRRGWGAHPRRLLLLPHLPAARHLRRLQPHPWRRRARRAAGRGRHGALRWRRDRCRSPGRPKGRPLQRGWWLHASRGGSCVRTAGRA